MNDRPLPRPSPALARHQHAVATALARHGLHLVACYPNGDRRPLYTGWQDYRTTPAQVAQWWNPTPNPYEQGAFSGPYAGAAVGLTCGPNNILVIDDDTARHNMPDSFRTVAAQHQDTLDYVPSLTTPRGGTHFYFSNPDGLGNGTGKLPSKIDVRGKGGFVFAPASFTMYGQYGDLHPSRIREAPPVPTWLRDTLKAGNADKGLCLIAFGGLEQLREPLRHINPDCSRHEWALVLAAIHKETDGSGDGLALAHEWSASGRKYFECLDGDTRNGAALLDHYWLRFDASRGGLSGARYLRHLAINNGWRPSYTTTPDTLTIPKLTYVEAKAEEARALEEAERMMRERLP